MSDAFKLPKRKIGLFARLRSNFLTGLVVIAPIALTAWLIWTVIGWIDGFVLPFLPDQFHPDILIYSWFGIDTQLDSAGHRPVGSGIRGVGVIVFLVFTVLVGWIAKGFIGRSLLRLGENMLQNIPIVRSVYSGVKQIAETVLNRTDRSFEKACMVEYPRKGIWAIGFIATAARGEIDELNDGKDLTAVFVPTTPNPTSGFLLYFPRKDIAELDMSVEHAAKLVISAGLVYPPEKPQLDKKDAGTRPA